MVFLQTMVAPVEETQTTVLRIKILRIIDSVLFFLSDNAVVRFISVILGS